jgi:hypothetical protein
MEDYYIVLGSIGFSEKSPAGCWAFFLSTGRTIVRYYFPVQLHGSQ